MRRYGTEAVFLAKTAGEASSLLAQLSMGILNFKMEKDRQKSYDQTRLEDEARAEITQAHERQRMHTATDHLLHTQAPLLISAAGSKGGRGELSADQVPVGMDEGMVRLACIAIGAGEELATKLALGVPLPTKGILSSAKNFLGGGLGMKGNLLAIGGTAAAGLALNKGLNATSSYMQQDSRGPANYGPRGGYQLPMGVSPQGQPQL